MRRLFMIALLAICTAQVGCGYDAAFTLLGDFYSGGGDTRAAKEAHFRDQVRQYE